MNGNGLVIYSILTVFASGVATIIFFITKFKYRYIMVLVIPAVGIVVGYAVNI